MITPELLEYVRVEIAKGKTREEIHGTLISGGGWSEPDLSEAFKIIIPMQRPAAEIEEFRAGPSGSTPDNVGTGTSPSSYSPSLSLLKSIVPVPTLTSVEPKFQKECSQSKAISAVGNLIFIIIGLFCVVSWYFYQPQITNFWNNGIESSQEFLVNSWNSLEKFSMDSWNFSVNSLKKLSFPSFNFSFLNKSKNVVPNTPVENNTNNIAVSAPVVPPVIQVKDCGIGVTPKLDNPATYKNDPVLFCLGENAINCENAMGILKDDLFPTIFEITKLQDSCNFKLSYSTDSALTDITGKKLAGQYISCPINIIKAIDNTKIATPKFIAPDKTDFSKYGSQIYFYGTLGLFVENNLDPNRIQNLGCEGGYIQSMIASYNLSQKK